MDPPEDGKEEEGKANALDQMDPLEDGKEEEDKANALDQMDPPEDGKEEEDKANALDQMDPPEDVKEETSTSSLPGIQEVLPGILREVLPGILREILAERWEATVGRRGKKTQEATDNDNDNIATKIRRLDGQQHRLGCPICLGGWCVSSGVGYIKHWNQLHSKHMLPCRQTKLARTKL